MPKISDTINEKKERAFKKCGDAAIKFDADESYDYSKDGCTDEEIAYALWYYDTEYEDE